MLFLRRLSTSIVLKALRTYLNKRFPLTPSRDIPAEYHNLEDIKLIGFAYNIKSVESGDALSQIIECIGSQNIPYKGLVMESKRNALKKILVAYPELGKNQNITIITKNYLSWTGIPDIHRSAKFFSHVYDLFINFNSRSDFKFDYITKRAKSKFSVGMRSSALSLYSMVLEGEYKSTLDEAEYVKQVFHYVKAIKAGGENEQQIS